MQPLAVAPHQLRRFASGLEQNASQLARRFEETRGLEIGSMTGQKQSWEEISKQYNQQWVELVDYEWREGSPFPQRGVVRVHEADRKKFHALVQKQSPSGSALVFVGVPEKHETAVYNNLCKELDTWAYLNGVKLDFIRPGNPVDNAYIESFHGRVRDECLDANLFFSLAEVREELARWKKDYNWIRPHGSLGGMPPSEFSATTTMVAQKAEFSKNPWH